MTKHRFIVVFLALQLIGFARISSFVVDDGYLPSPFLLNKNDTLMDFFNTAYWASQGGEYEIWKSVYPPLVFSTLKFISNWLADPDSWVIGSVAARNDSTILQYAFIALYLVVALGVVCFREWKRFSLLSRICIAVIYAISFPALFALERGNMIVILPLLISASISARNKFLWGLLVAICVNVKPYMAILSLCAISMRSIVGLFFVAIFASFLFFGFGELIDEPYLLFFKNLILFSGSEDVLLIKDILSLPSSIASFSHLFLTYDMQDKSKFLYENALWIGKSLDLIRIVTLVFCSYVLIVNPNGKGIDELTFLCICMITNLGLSVGGYSLILYYSIIPCALLMRYRVLYMLLLSAMFSPMDLIPIYSAHDDIQMSFISDSIVYVDWFVSAGALLRPILNFILIVIVAVDIYRKPAISINRLH